MGAGSWQGEQCCLRRGMGNEAVLPRVLSRLGQSKVTWFSVTWDPEAVGTDAPQSLSWDAGERQPPPQRSSGGCAPCRAGAGRCPQAKGSHISRAGRQERLLEKETQRPGEKLGGDVRDRDPAYGE